jgi:hypothetical protein
MTFILAALFNLATENLTQTKKLTKQSCHCICNFALIK